jgi:uncharacterized membrane protein HdeD (DUF308 family)
MADFKLPSGKWLLITGVLLSLLGLGAIIAPAVAGTTVIYIVGGLLVVTGLILLVVGWRDENWSSKLPNLVYGAIATLTGGSVLAHPFYGLAALALVLAVYFVASGIWKIISSFSYRPAAGWLALLASGVLSVLLGVMLWQQWPLSGPWAVGILVGVELLTTGIALISLALTWKRVVRNVKAKVEVAKERIAGVIDEVQNR